MSKHSVFIRPVLGADEVAVNSPDKVSVLISHRRQICKLGRGKGVGRVSYQYFQGTGSRFRSPDLNSLLLMAMRP